MQRNIKAVSSAVMGDVREEAQPAIEVSKLFVYPIKSCAGTEITSASFTRFGFEYDRQWMLLDVAKHKALTAREISKMVRIFPSIQRDDTAPDEGKLVVSFPDDPSTPSFAIPLNPPAEELATWEKISDVTLWWDKVDGYVVPAAEGADASPSEILSAHLGRQCLLLMKGPKQRVVPDTDASLLSYDGGPDTRFADGYPFMLLSSASLADAEQHIRLVASSAADAVPGMDAEAWKTKSLPASRFRPNIVVRAVGGREMRGFEEDDWVEISVGEEQEVRLLLPQRCTRCQLPNIDPETGIKDAAIPYKVLSKYRRVDKRDKYSPCLGMNVVPVNSEGTISVGDRVRVVKAQRKHNLLEGDA